MSMRTAWTVPAALAAALFAAGCGGSNAASTVVRTVTVSNSVTTSATTPTTSTAITATETTASGPPACVASDLELSYAGSNGAAGNVVLQFALTNGSSKPCHTYGFPGVEFLSRSGTALPTKATRSTDDIAGKLPERAITLQGGEQASFRLVVPQGVGSSAGCQNAYGLQAIAPDDTATMHVSFPSGTYECGTATVSPLEPGTSAFPGQ
jgi:uncharacterized protein DUF4232